MKPEQTSNPKLARAVIRQHVRPGRGEYGDVFVTIQYADGRLSITGVEGPKANGDATGGCGQITEALAYVADFAPGWDAEKVAKLREVWDRWHLNHMRAGSEVQEEWLRECPIPCEDYAYPKSYYEVASARLRGVGLNPDPQGYLYGHAWRQEEIPAEVLEWLEALPVADKAMPGSWGRF